MTQDLQAMTAGKLRRLWDSKADRDVIEALETLHTRVRHLEAKLTPAAETAACEHKYPVNLGHGYHWCSECGAVDQGHYWQLPQRLRPTQPTQAPPAENSQTWWNRSTTLPSESP